MFQWFEKNGFLIEEKFQGIFYISKEGSFPTQVLVSKYLPKDSQKWLTLLSSDLEKEDAERVVSQMELLADESEKQYGDSVLQVAMKENKTLFRKLKEEEKMCEALRELFEPEMNDAIQANRKDMIMNALKIGSSVEEISKVMGIPLEEVRAVATSM